MATEEEIEALRAWTSEPRDRDAPQLFEAASIVGPRGTFQDRLTVAAFLSGFRAGRTKGDP